MRLHGLAMIRNEADIVESFVRHHLGLLDGLSVIVHLPTDGTPQILDALRNEGLPLELLMLNELGYNQGQRTTEAARSVFSRHRPDRLLLLDADEFVRVGSRAELEQALATIPEGSQGLIPWHTYIPAEEDDSEETEPVRRMRHRYPGVSSTDQYFKLVLGKAFAIEPSLVICHGNHALASPDSVKDRATRYHPLDGVLLAHYPVRSAEHILSKVLVGWLSHIVIGDTVGRDAHWRELYERLRVSPTLDAGSVTALALKYARHFNPAAQSETVQLIDDPLPTNFDIKYAHLRLTEPLAHVVGFAERLAAEYHTLQQRARQRGLSV